MKYAGILGRHDDERSTYQSGGSLSFANSRDPRCARTAEGFGSSGGDLRNQPTSGGVERQATEHDVYVCVVLLIYIQHGLCSQKILIK